MLKLNCFFECEKMELFECKANEEANEKRQKQQLGINKNAFFHVPLLNYREKKTNFIAHIH